MRTRIAPTPSGFLHVGNAANALLTHWWARHEEGTTLLRIDDVDAPRVRPEYVADIHDLLAWLGITVTPVDPDLGPAASSRRARITRARAALESARRAGMPVYACRCSRSALDGVPRGGCPGGCRDGRHVFEPGLTSLRIEVGPGAVVETDLGAVDVAATMGDFVVWRRDDLPAYQWVSVVEDTDHAITHILRGADLRDSTAAQLHLARYLDDSRFLEATIRHHGLLTDDRGVKLSKSQLGASSALPRTEQSRREIERHAHELGRAIGLPVG